VGRYDWVQMLFLLFRGELPTPEQDRLLNIIMAAIINPGPRDAAVRAAMNCGIGKTPVSTILSAGLAVRGGMAEGSLHVETAMRFFLGQLPYDENRDAASPDLPLILIRDYDHLLAEDPERDVVPLPPHPPGFGLYYGERDPRPIMLLAKLKTLGKPGESLSLALEMESHLSRERGIYLTAPGILAAACCDLGLLPEQGAGLFLIAGSAGILAHGIEQLPRRWNEYPTWADPKYCDFQGPERGERLEATS